ncbi:hypothetical protein BLNAU_21488 [Blattamonas nauphoetae]|uniref:Uncharacterized protein n=1 Tax=Blattamonas nauphoetae TaxID=2049346 RepID=A0ABQ9WWA8_9EUKA|nr:hypothetical protein BLNAU_21488 [Blattamonas nauphoetae]
MNGKQGPIMFLQTLRDHFPSLQISGDLSSSRTIANLSIKHSNTRFSISFTASEVTLPFCSNGVTFTLTPSAIVKDPHLVVVKHSSLIPSITQLPFTQNDKIITEEKASRTSAASKLVQAYFIEPLFKKSINRIVSDLRNSETHQIIMQSLNVLIIEDSLDKREWVTFKSKTTSMKTKHLVETFLNPNTLVSDDIAAFVLENFEVISTFVELSTGIDELSVATEDHNCTVSTNNMYSLSPSMDCKTARIKVSIKELSASLSGTLKIHSEQSNTDSDEGTKKKTSAFYSMKSTHSEQWNFSILTFEPTSVSINATCIIVSLHSHNRAKTTFTFTSLVISSLVHGEISLPLLIKELNEECDQPSQINVSKPNAHSAFSFTTKHQKLKMRDIFSAEQPKLYINSLSLSIDSSTNTTSKEHSLHQTFWEQHASPTTMYSSLCKIDKAVFIPSSQMPLSFSSEGTLTDSEDSLIPINVLINSLNHGKFNNTGLSVENLAVYIDWTSNEKKHLLPSLCLSDCDSISISLRNIVDFESLVPLQTFFPTSQSQPSTNHTPPFSVKTSRLTLVSEENKPKQSSSSCRKGPSVIISSENASLEHSLTPEDSILLTGNETRINVYNESKQPGIMSYFPTLGFSSSWRQKTQDVDTGRKDDGRLVFSEHQIKLTVAGNAQLNFSPSFFTSTVSEFILEPLSPLVTLIKATIPVRKIDVKSRQFLIQTTQVQALCSLSDASTPILLHTPSVSVHVESTPIVQVTGRSKRIVLDPSDPTFLLIESLGFINTCRVTFEQGTTLSLVEKESEILTVLSISRIEIAHRTVKSHSNVIAVPTLDETEGVQIVVGSVTLETKQEVIDSLSKTIAILLKHSSLLLFTRLQKPKNLAVSVELIKANFSNEEMDDAITLEMSLNANRAQNLFSTQFNNFSMRSDHSVLSSINQIVYSNGTVVTPFAVERISPFLAVPSSFQSFLLFDGTCNPVFYADPSTIQREKPQTPKTDVGTHNIRAVALTQLCEMWKEKSWEREKSVLQAETERLSQIRQRSTKKKTWTTSDSVSPFSTLSEPVNAQSSEKWISERESVRAQEKKELTQKFKQESKNSSPEETPKPFELPKDEESEQIISVLRSTLKLAQKSQKSRNVLLTPRKPIVSQEESKNEISQRYEMVERKPIKSLVFDSQSSPHHEPHEEEIAEFSLFVLEPVIAANATSQETDEAAQLDLLHTDFVRVMETLDEKETTFDPIVVMTDNITIDSLTLNVPGAKDSKHSSKLNELIGHMLESVVRGVDSMLPAINRIILDKKTKEEPSDELMTPVTIHLNNTSLNVIEDGQTFEERIEEHAEAMFDELSTLHGTGDLPFDSDSFEKKILRVKEVENEKHHVLMSFTLQTILLHVTEERENDKSSLRILFDVTRGEGTISSFTTHPLLSFKKAALALTFVPLPHQDEHLNTKTDSFEDAPSNALTPFNVPDVSDPPQPISEAAAFELTSLSITIERPTITITDHQRSLIDAILFTIPHPTDTFTRHQSPLHSLTSVIPFSSLFERTRLSSSFRGAACVHHVTLSLAVPDSIRKSMEYARNMLDKPSESNFVQSVLFSLERVAAVVSPSHCVLSLTNGSVVLPSAVTRKGFVCSHLSSVLVPNCIVTGSFDERNFMFNLEPSSSSAPSLIFELSATDTALILETLLHHLTDGCSTFNIIRRFSLRTPIVVNVNTSKIVGAMVSSSALLTGTVFDRIVETLPIVTGSEEYPSENLNPFRVVLSLASFNASHTFTQINDNSFDNTAFYIKSPKLKLFNATATVSKNTLDHSLSHTIADAVPTTAFKSGVAKPSLMFLHSDGTRQKNVLFSKQPKVTNAKKQKIGIEFVSSAMTTAEQEAESGNFNIVDIPTWTTRQSSPSTGKTSDQMSMSEVLHSLVPHWEPFVEWASEQIQLARPATSSSDSPDRRHATPSELTVDRLHLTITPFSLQCASDLISTFDILLHIGKQTTVQILRDPMDVDRVNMMNSLRNTPTLTCKVTAAQIDLLMDETAESAIVLASSRSLFELSSLTTLQTSHNDDHVPVEIGKRVKCVVEPGFSIISLGREQVESTPVEQIIATVSSNIAVSVVKFNATLIPQSQPVTSVQCLISAVNVTQPNLTSLHVLTQCTSTLISVVSSLPSTAARLSLLFTLPLSHRTIVSIANNFLTRVLSDYPVNDIVLACQNLREDQCTGSSLSATLSFFVRTMNLLSMRESDLIDGIVTQTKETVRTFNTLINSEDQVADENLDLVESAAQYGTTMANSVLFHRTLQAFVTVLSSTNNSEMSHSSKQKQEPSTLLPSFLNISRKSFFEMISSNHYNTFLSVLKGHGYVVEPLASTQIREKFTLDVGIRVPKPVRPAVPEVIDEEKRAKQEKRRQFIRDCRAKGLNPTEERRRLREERKQVRKMERQMVRRQRIADAKKRKAEYNRKLETIDLELEIADTDEERVRLQAEKEKLITDFAKQESQSKQEKEMENEKRKQKRLLRMQHKQRSDQNRTPNPDLTDMSSAPNTPPPTDTSQPALLNPRAVKQTKAREGVIIPTSTPALFEDQKRPFETASLLPSSLVFSSSNILPLVDAEAAQEDKSNWRASFFSKFRGYVSANSTAQLDAIVEYLGSVLCEEVTAPSVVFTATVGQIVILPSSEHTSDDVFTFSARLTGLSVSVAPTAEGSVIANVNMIGLDVRESQSNSTNPIGRISQIKHKEPEIDEDSSSEGVSDESNSEREDAGPERLKRHVLSEFDIVGASCSFTSLETLVENNIATSPNSPFLLTHLLFSFKAVPSASERCVDAATTLACVNQRLLRKTGFTTDNDDYTANALGLSFVTSPQTKLQILDLSLRNTRFELTEDFAQQLSDVLTSVLVQPLESQREELVEEYNQQMDEYKLKRQDKMRDLLDSRINEIETLGEQAVQTELASKHTGSIMYVSAPPSTTDLIQFYAKLARQERGKQHQADTAALQVKSEQHSQFVSDSIVEFDQDEFAYLLLEYGVSVDQRHANCFVVSPQADHQKALEVMFRHARAAHLPLDEDDKKVEERLRTLHTQIEALSGSIHSFERLTASVNFSNCVLIEVGSAEAPVPIPLDTSKNELSLADLSCTPSDLVSLLISEIRDMKDAVKDLVSIALRILKADQKNAQMVDNAYYEVLLQLSNPPADGETERVLDKTRLEMFAEGRGQDWDDFYARVMKIVNEEFEDAEKKSPRQPKTLEPIAMIETQSRTAFPSFEKGVFVRTQQQLQTPSERKMEKKEKVAMVGMDGFTYLVILLFKQTLKRDEELRRKNERDLSMKDTLSLERKLEQIRHFAEGIRSEGGTT